MKKEQEEAIENLKGMLEYKKQVYNMDTMRNEIVPALYDIDRKAIETVLSMLKENSAELAEKNAEIEKFKQVLARNIARNVTSSMKESAKSKEDLEMLNAGWQIELEKKDKIIDLMAEEINETDRGYIDYCQ